MGGGAAVVRRGPLGPDAAALGAVLHRMSDLMTSYWTDFATRGDPNGPGLPS